MADLFLDPKVLNYGGDKYQLILLTLRWARALKARSSPDPMPVLVERALRDIVEQKVSPEEILANKAPVEAPVEETPAVVSVAGEGKADLEGDLVLAPDGEDESDKKSKKKKKKDE